MFLSPTLYYTTRYTYTYFELIGYNSAYLNYLLILCRHIYITIK